LTSQRRGTTIFLHGVKKKETFTRLKSGLPYPSCRLHIARGDFRHKISRYKSDSRQHEISRSREAARHNDNDFVSPGSPSDDFYHSHDCPDFIFEARLGAFTDNTIHDQRFHGSAEPVSGYIHSATDFDNGGWAGADGQGTPKQSFLR